MNLTLELKRTLLALARNAIESAVMGEVRFRPKSIDPALREKAGVFVTLNEGGDLRGCIGYIEPYFPLVEAVQEVAEKAALEDSRFAPVSPDELPRLTVEISVLSPLTEIHSADEVVVGTHGLVIDSGIRRGLLLPQVATDYGWDREEFLAHTCTKAGLPTDTWRRKDIRLFTFTVDCFSEAELLNKPHASLQ